MERSGRHIRVDTKGRESHALPEPRNHDGGERGNGFSDKTVRLGRRAASVCDTPLFRENGKLRQKPVLARSACRCALR